MKMAAPIEFNSDNTIIHLLDGDLRRSERESRPVRIIERQRIFTLDEWNKSGLELHQYLEYPCEIDEALYLYFAERLPLSILGFSEKGVVQGVMYFHPSDEPLRSFESYFVTATKRNNRYFYLGILPEFKQSDL